MIYITVLVTVVLVLAVVTAVKTRGVHNQTDFLVAGRKLPWTVLVFT